jgi:hypothetical protein
MRAKQALVIAAFAALALGTAQNALADNNATGSVGAVQTGPVGVTPTAGASQGGATANASAPVAVGGSGNNTATNSVGGVQAGGGNSSNNSTGTAQVSSASASPSASGGAAGNSTSAGVPLTVGGNGSNTASNSTGGAQIGGGNSSSGSSGVLQAGSVQGAPAVGASKAASSAASAAGLPSPGTRTSEGAPRRNRNTLGATKTPTGGPKALAQLPFTGLGLLLFVLLGLGLVATGLVTRSRTRPRLSV